MLVWDLGWLMRIKKDKGMKIDFTLEDYCVVNDLNLQPLVA